MTITKKIPHRLWVSPISPRTQAKKFINILVQKYHLFGFYSSTLDLFYEIKFNYLIRLGAKYASQTKSYKAFLSTNFIDYFTGFYVLKTMVYVFQPRVGGRGRCEL